MMTVNAHLFISFIDYQPRGGMGRIPKGSEVSAETRDEEEEEAVEWQ